MTAGVVIYCFAAIVWLACATTILRLERVVWPELTRRQRRWAAARVSLMFLVGGLDVLNAVLAL